MFANLIDRMIEASLRRARVRDQMQDAATLASNPGWLRLRNAPILAAPDGPITTRTRQFTVHDAMNGTYIEFQKRKYNPNGPDDYQREVYIVKDGESLIDAISTVLVLTEK